MDFNNISLSLIITLIFGGIICASVYDYYSRKFLGGFLKKLSEKEAFDEDSSVTLAELGYKRIKKALLGFSLGDSSSLRNYVNTKFSAEQAQVLREQGKGDQKYYLDPEKKETALERYDSKNMKLWKLILGIVGCIVAAILCISIFPYIISMVGGVGENFNTDQEVKGAKVENTVLTTAEETQEAE